MSPVQIVIRPFTPDEATAWRAIRLEALRHSTEAFGSTLENTQIHLNVVTTKTAAYGLYRSMGFVTYGIEPRSLRLEGRDFDEALMVCVLD